MIQPTQPLSVVVGGQFNHLCFLLPSVSSNHFAKTQNPEAQWELSTWWTAELKRLILKRLTEFPIEIVTVHAENADGSLDGKFDIGKVGFDLGKIGFKAKAEGDGQFGFGGSVGFGGGGFGGEAGFGGSFGGKIEFGDKLEVKSGILKIGKVAFGGKADVGLRGKLGSVNISLDEKHVKAPKSLLGKLSGKISSIWQFGRESSSLFAIELQEDNTLHFRTKGYELLKLPVYAWDRVTIIPDENSNEVKMILGEDTLTGTPAEGEMDSKVFKLLFYLLF
ncbi:hypothetical protein CEXT_84611 [Caerostris extrusa]|uniref:Uncharacterized protein n=1 Tax=Caerostris extrusa TaxID=172846 RepID=A0AAV4Y0K8_CAEEX|nr:hypothetical protein CEXT_84611 [Caerostris extrusa]